MTDEERLALRDAHRRCRAPLEAEDYLRYDAADMIFHRLILEGCRNDILVEQTLSVRRLLKPWRWLQFYTPGRIDASFGEHEAIVAAIVASDPVLAEQLTRAHVDRQGQAVDRMVAESDVSRCRCSAVEPPPA